MKVSNSYHYLLNRYYTILHEQSPHKEAPPPLIPPPPPAAAAAVSLPPPVQLQGNEQTMTSSASGSACVRAWAMQRSNIKRTYIQGRLSKQRE
eukprot:COSAG06_NODE_1627_length_8882_cov_9.423659_11_plen_93_part_00